MQKTCYACKRALPIKGFLKSKSNKDGYKGTCRECVNKQWNERYKEKYKYSSRQRSRDWTKNNPEKVKNRTLLKNYGISLSDYNLYKEYQNAGCAICGTVDPKPFKQLVVDHAHITGRFRGLLCPKCNTGLGMFTDSEEKLRKAAQYMKTNTVDKLILELENESISR